MSRKIPNIIKEEIYKEVEVRALEAGYGNTNRAESNKFIDKLLNEPLVGGKIAGYLKKDKVRTYIKDSLLNRYNKKVNSLPQDVGIYIKEIFGETAVELDYEKNNRVSFHKFDTQSDQYLVVARGTFIKWETAVRKALNYIICSPSAKILDASHIKILLVVMVDNKGITEADKETLKRCLNIINLNVSFMTNGNKFSSCPFSI